MEGQAHFVKNDADPHLLHYREEGAYQDPNGQCFNAYREYHYRLQSREWAVYFSERPAALLHSLTFKIPSFERAPLVAEGMHRCSEDYYTARYEFYDSNRFHLSYRVTGPLKDYIITTLFERSVNYL